MALEAAGRYVLVEGGIGISLAAFYRGISNKRLTKELFLPFLSAFRDHHHEFPPPMES